MYSSAITEKGVNMNITNEMINSEIRRTGILIRKILPSFKRSTFKRCNFWLKMKKGRGGKGMKFEQIFIPQSQSISKAKKLRLCVYSPLIKKKNATGLIWIHGGGYGLGIPEQDEAFIRDFVIKHNCVVVSPDYTLSVTAPYPAALNDCYESLLWLKENAYKYDVNENQIMVGGNSAGGGLTVALTIYARDKGEVAIAYQIPLYPMLDDRMATTSSQNSDAPVWNTKSNEVAWEMYLGRIFGTDYVPAYAAPARLKNYNNLPPAFSYVGSIDPFRDETIDYMENLKKVGIKANYKVFDGCYHAFDVLGRKTTLGKEANDLLMENFKFAQDNYFAQQPKNNCEKDIQLKSRFL